MDRNPLLYRLSFLSFSAVLLALPSAAQTTGSAQRAAGQPAARQAGAVLVELFTSEGCSSCPPADALLRQIDGHPSPAGQLVVGLSEHVTYWNGLGWTDPFSTAQSTDRQNMYGRRFALESVYTPQMVVNGREQFVGSDRRSLHDALEAEAKQKQIALHILSAKVSGKNLEIHYAAAELPAHGWLELFAALADDSDQQSVPRGENSGRELVHTSVVRALATAGKLQATEDATISLPLPPSFLAEATQNKPRHVVLFAQRSGFGEVVGIDTRPLR